MTKPFGGRIPPYYAARNEHLLYDVNTKALASILERGAPVNIDVIFVDDHAVLRDGVKRFLSGSAKDIEIVRETDSGKDFLKIAKKTPADVYLVDLHLKDMDGFEVLDELLKQDPARKVIILSVEDQVSWAQRAICCGAMAYVTKGRAHHDLPEAIRKAHAGECFLSRDIAKVARGNCPCKKWKSEKRKRLTLREGQVLQLTNGGFSNKDIAMKLGLKYNTVLGYRKAVMRKLDAHTGAELVHHAFREGYLAIQPHGWLTKQRRKGQMSTPILGG